MEKEEPAGRLPEGEPKLRADGGPFQSFHWHQFRVDPHLRQEEKGGQRRVVGTQRGEVEWAAPRW